MEIGNCKQQNSLSMLKHGHKKHISVKSFYLSTFSIALIGRPVLFFNSQQTTQTTLFFISFQVKCPKFTTLWLVLRPLPRLLSFPLPSLLAIPQLAIHLSSASLHLTLLIPPTLLSSSLQRKEAG